MSPGRHWFAAPLLACVALVSGCDGRSASDQSDHTPQKKPNILLVVWDTARADRLSLYGHQRATTPHLDELAREARVFENCISAASTTVPSHASILTGLLPTEHRVTNGRPRLPESLETLAELLRDSGYRTYMFSENPNICALNDFTQGFDLAEHPWSEPYMLEAIRITRRKLNPADVSNELGQKFKRQKVTQWDIKATGRLAQKGVESWLAKGDPERPFFIFLNYMEAHRPLIPRLKYRQQIMTPGQVLASYRVDRTWLSTWAFTFGLRSYTPEEVGLTQATYDAALLELDDLLHDLLEALRLKGYSENTIVVLVSDHGEHLCEHHLLDHQYSVYEPLMRVPLVIHYPAGVAPGREKRPVMNFDLFPTLLELAGIDPPVQSKAVSLLRPLAKRARFGEYPEVMSEALERVQEAYPDFDPTPWKRALRAYYDEPYKLIQASDGRHELYHLEDDPGELRNLIGEKPLVVRRLAADLQAYVGSLKTITTQPQKAGPMDADQRRRLEALGYVGASEDDKDEPNDPEVPKQEDDEP